MALSAVLRKSLLAVVPLGLVFYAVLLGTGASVFNSTIGNSYMLQARLTNELLLHISLSLVSLIAGVVGLASVFSGSFYIFSRNTGSYSVAVSIASIATFTSLLALGFSSKHAHETKNHGDGVTKSLEAFAILSGIWQLGYVIVLYLINEGNSLYSVNSTTAPKAPEVESEVAADVV